MKIKKPMDWIKATVTTTPADVEVILAVLLAEGISGAQITDNSDLRQILGDNPLTWDYVDESLFADSGNEALVTFYVPSGVEGRVSLGIIKNKLAALHAALSVEYVNDELWMHEWKKHFKPFRLGRRIVIAPAWEAYNAIGNDIVLSIDPGSAFGTGQHQTTQLCAEALEQCVFSGSAVLDIGCGSGILSIISLLLGSGRALACDFDPAALASVSENAARNLICINRLQIHIGDIFTDVALRQIITSNPFDIVVANMVADPIIKLAPLVSGFLKPNGIFIASGIIPERIDEVTQSLIDSHLSVSEILEKDGWFATVCRCHA
jgi:ribosomal protein L11 methyltransferase